MAATSMDVVVSADYHWFTVFDIAGERNYRFGVLAEPLKR
jgi:hypothetical protein